jgi:hypothetical protein
MLDIILAIDFVSFLLGISSFILQFVFLLLQVNSIIDFKTSIHSMRPIKEWILINKNPLPIAGYLIPQILINNVFNVNDTKAFLIKKFGGKHISLSKHILKFLLNLIIKFNKNVGMYRFF